MWSFFRISTVFALLLFPALTVKAAESKQQELTLYAYDSFVSQWGPGPRIQKQFEAQCNCKIKWVTSDDGAAILTRLKLEGKKNSADIVIGLDTNLVAQAHATGFFETYTPKNYAKMSLPTKADLKNTFIPFDYGWFSLMANTSKVKKLPTSFKEFLEKSDYKKSLIIEDPSVSTPGLGLLLWIKALYGKDSEAALKKLADQTLMVTKGWSEAYGLFTKGEAPFVLSYTSSEAYHRIKENKEQFKAVLFSEGHYVQVEVAALMATSNKKSLAKEFLDFIFTNSFQEAMVIDNWMYPVIELKSLTNIPKAFLSLQQPGKSLILGTDEVFANRKLWIQEWQKAFH